MRQFYDALVFDGKCADFGRKLGYSGVFFDEAAYCEPKTAKDIKTVSGKINFVRGGALELNQAIVRKKGVNVLLDPFGQKKEFDTAVGQIAKDYNIFIGISLYNILANKVNRARLLANIASTIGICKKMKNDLVIVSGAKNVYDMRAPRELASLGTLFGLTDAQSLWAISESPRALLEGL